MSEILFVVEDDPEGGYNAHSVTTFDSIFTFGETMDQLKSNIMDALRCHFDDETDIPPVIRLHYVKDETLRYAPV